MIYYSVFVGQLPRNATKVELCELFEDCGQIYDVYISHSKSHMLYSFGFIRFLEPNSVLKAVQQLGPWTLHGQALKVELSYATKDHLRQTTGPRYPSSQTVSRDQDDRSRLKEACFMLNSELDLIHNDDPLDAVWLLARLELKPLNCAPKLKGTVSPETRTTKESLYDSIGAVSTGKPSAIAKRELMRRMDELQADLEIHLLKTASAAEQRKGACNLEKAGCRSEDGRSETAPTADQRKEDAGRKACIQQADVQSHRCSESVTRKEDHPRNTVPKHGSPKERRETCPSHGGFTWTEMNTRRAIVAADGQRMVSDMDNSQSNPATTSGRESPLHESNSELKSSCRPGSEEVFVTADLVRSGQLLNEASQCLNTDGDLSILPPAVQSCNQLGMPSRLLQQLITRTSGNLNTSNAEVQNAVLTKALCLGLGVLVELGSNALQGLLQMNNTHSLPKQLTGTGTTAPGATQAACSCHTPPPDQQSDSLQSGGNTPPPGQQSDSLQSGGNTPPPDQQSDSLQSGGNTPPPDQQSDSLQSGGNTPPPDQQSDSLQSGGNTPPPDQQSDSLQSGGNTPPPDQQSDSLQSGGNTPPPDQQSDSLQSGGNTPPPDQQSDSLQSGGNTPPPDQQSDSLQSGGNTPPPDQQSDSLQSGGNTPPPDQQSDSLQSGGNTPPQSQGQPSCPTPDGNSLPQNKPDLLSKSAGWQRLRDSGFSQGGTTVPPKPPLVYNDPIDVVARSAYHHRPPQNHGSASGNSQTDSTTSDPFLTEKEGAANSSHRSCTLYITETITQTSPEHYSWAWDQDQGHNLLTGKDRHSKERINLQTSLEHSSSASDQGHDLLTGKDRHSREVNPRTSTPNSSSPSEQGEDLSFERDELLFSGQSSGDYDEEEEEEGVQSSSGKATPRQDTLEGIHAQFGDEKDSCLEVDNASWFQCGVTYSRMQVGSRCSDYQSDSGISLAEVSHDAESHNVSLDTATQSARYPDQAVWAVVVSEKKPMMSSEKVQCCEEAGSGNSQPVSAMAKEKVLEKSEQVLENQPSGTTLQNCSASKAKEVVTASSFQGKMVQGGLGHGRMTASNIQGKSKLQGGRGRGSMSLLKQVRQQLLTDCSSTPLVSARGRGQSSVL